MTKRTGITIEEIAATQGKTRSRIYQIAESKGFPDPEYTVGKNKIYDPRKVERYFAKRGDRRALANA